MHPLDRAWESLKHDFEASCSRQARAAQESVTAQLNQLFRRMRQYQSEAEWITILSDGAAAFASELAIFGVETGTLQLRAARGLNLAPDLTIASPPAFVTAIDSKDPVVVLRTASEVGPELSLSGGRASIIPIINGDRIVAILFAPLRDDDNPHALELVVGIASAVLERRTNRDLHTQIQMIQSPARAVSPSPSSWDDLSPEDQKLHLRAQRFARVAVAEAQMSRPAACAAGRKTRDIYLFMKNEIEKAREIYQKQFMVTPSMVDYLHLELVKVMAENDEAAMGAEYPGAMV